MAGHCWPSSPPRQSGRLSIRSSHTQPCRLRPDVRSAASARLAHPQQSPTQQPITPWQSSHTTSPPWRKSYSSRQPSGKQTTNNMHQRQFQTRSTAAAAWFTHLRRQMTQRGRRLGAAAGQVCTTAGIASTLAPTHVTSHVWSGSQALAQTLARYCPSQTPFKQRWSLMALASQVVSRDLCTIYKAVPDYITIMRSMGYLVLVGACFRSVPQILRIVRAKRATGVSLTSNVVELLAYSITMAYNFRLGYAFSTYGEVVACWVQDVALVAIIARLSGISDWRMFWAAAAFGLYCWWLTSTACTAATLTILQASTISMIALGGRLPQIVLNIRRRGSGELSMTTCLLNLVGNIVRIFTTLVLTQDPLILTGNAVQALLNTVLLWQTVHTTMKRSRRTRGTEGHLEGEEGMGLSPAAIEAAESEPESPEGGAVGDGGAGAMGGGGDGGDGGGYGGVGSAFLEITPVDFPMGTEGYE